MKSRKDKAFDVRVSAANLAYHRPVLRHISSGDEIRLRFQASPATLPNRAGEISLINAFTKGFEHDDEGFVRYIRAFEEFIQASDSGDLTEVAHLRLFTGPFTSFMANNPTAVVRGWESMASGLTYDLEGPDAQAVTIPPCPALESFESAAEVCELYWMALCRDINFASFDSSSTITNAISHLNSLEWFANPNSDRLADYQKKRKRGLFDTQNIFRGNVKGDDIGFYISQFLYVGNKSLGASTVSYGEDQGLIAYGSSTIDQRVRIAASGKNYMTTWEQWLDVQNGANLRERETYVNSGSGNNVNREIGYRFIINGRDLATWVHYDALHQAYFNACLILLAIRAPFDPGIPFSLPDGDDKQTGFATFGGPHILNLVSEVATRALKAVRYQKYSVHRRARPEQIGGWVHRFHSGHTSNLSGMETVMNALTSAPGNNLLNDIQTMNGLRNLQPDCVPDMSAGLPSWLLPMAFAEGSPMHPSYGSGHATVAGACVTILKAFFDAGFVLPYHYRPSNNGSNLIDDPANAGKYTVETELNKLASNVAIGRNWGGVHWYSDQIESLRLGEQIALGILEEQKLTYGENFSMSIPLFDGTVIRI